MLRELCHGFLRGLEVDLNLAGGAMAPEDSTPQQESDQKRQYWNTHITDWNLRDDEFTGRW